MKKMVLCILAVLALLLVAFVAWNLIDAKPAAGIFSEAELPAPDLSADNAFYQLWTLGMPDDVDVESEEVRARFRRLSDPALDFEREVKTFDVLKYKDETSLRKRLGSRFFGDLNWAWNLGNGLLRSEKIGFVRSTLEEFRQTHAKLLERYRRFLASEKFADFTLTRVESPFPNLVTWLHLARIYKTMALADSASGKWEEGADALLDQVRLAKKAAAGSRTLITQLVAKGVLRLSLEGLAVLINDRECPSSIYAQVHSGLPPLQPGELDSRLPLMGEFFYMKDVLSPLSTRKVFGFGKFWNSLFLQKNRTLNEVYFQTRTMIECDSQMPYTWPLEKLDPPDDYKKGVFWWLRNAAGKELLHFAMVNRRTVVDKSWNTRVLYDLVRISSELHLRYDPKKSVPENLAELQSAQAVDPYSGKPFLWNGQKQVLYSLGPDRKDGGGDCDIFRAGNESPQPDVGIPCLLWVRSNTDGMSKR